MTTKNKTNAKRSRAENQQIIKEWVEETYFRFIKLPANERQAELKVFDEVIEAYPDNPRIRDYFENLKNAFLSLETE